MFGIWLYLIIPNINIDATVIALYVAYAKPTGIADIPFASENMVIHISSMQATDGVNFVNPSDIFARLFAIIPHVMAINKKIYPANGFILVSFS